MKIVDGYPRFKAISGFGYQQDMIEIMNIHQANAGITPFCAIEVKKELTTFRTGFYIAFCANISYKELIRLDVLMDEMMVDGQIYDQDTKAVK